MEWFLYLAVLLICFDVEAKVSKLLKKDNKVLNKKMIEELINKQVNLIVSNEGINNSHLFSSSSKVKGIIKECDDIWINFEYQDKKETTIQYFRIKDITSINEIK